MASGQEEIVLRQFRRLFGPGGSLGLTEGQLLARFAADGDPSAFEALVDRHGPMVLGVCRRMLRDPNDADDAFQATFLVLVRRAGLDPRRRAARPLAARRRRAGRLAGPFSRREVARPRAARPSRKRRRSPEDRSRLGVRETYSTRSWAASPRNTDRRSSSATSKGGRTRRRPVACDGRSAPSRGGWLGHATSCVHGSHAGGWSPRRRP